jgi:hypothetical protein
LSDSSNIVAPVIAGLAAGIALVIGFSQIPFAALPDLKWSPQLASTCMTHFDCPETDLIKNCNGSVTFHEDSRNYVTFDTRGVQDGYCKIRVTEGNSSELDSFMHLTMKECLIPTDKLQMWKTPAVHQLSEEIDAFSCEAV